MCGQGFKHNYSKVGDSNKVYEEEKCCLILYKRVMCAADNLLLKRRLGIKNSAALAPIHKYNLKRHPEKESFQRKGRPKNQNRVWLNLV